VNPASASAAGTRTPGGGITRSKHTQEQTIQDQIDTQQTALQTALQKSQPDANAIAAILIQIQSLQKQIQMIETSFLTQAVATLTADQKTKLTALQNAQSLVPAVHRAEGLNLIAPPANAQGGPLGGPPPRGAGPMGFGNSLFRRAG
jgi:chromosome segregation ATPase